MTCLSKEVYGQLFGSPQVFLDGQPVIFSFGKINALLFYMFVNKTVSRDEVAGLLWPEMDEKNAKKNLRNTIYQANKILGDDFIYSPNRKVLVLNQELKITSDVEKFKEQPDKFLNLYRNQFLKGFFLKDSEDFELWTIKMRNYFEKTFINECYRKVKDDIAQGEYKDVEKHIQQLIDIDEFDERNYRLLMDYYQKINRHDKVIEVYYEVADILHLELGIDPGQETRQLFETSLNIVNVNNISKPKRFTSGFFGRLEEIKQLESNFKSFSKGEKAYSVLVEGPGGVGKTGLVNRVLDNVDDNYHILETQCYELEINYDLRMWRQIFSQITKILAQEQIQAPKGWESIVATYFPSVEGDITQTVDTESKKHLDLNMLSQVLVDALRIISGNTKVVIVCKNIQWIDEASFNLLLSTMLHINNDQVLFVFTLRDDIPMHVHNFLAVLNSYDLLMELKLKPLSYDETKEYAIKELGDKKATTQIVDRLYQLTEGNFFFLVEYINMIKNNNKLDIMNIKMQDALRNRFINLTSQELRVVSIVSYFYDYVSIKFLSEILKIPNIELAEMIEKLVNESIFTEYVVNEDIKISFCHNRFREFIYMNEFESKKCLVHREIAELLEKELPRLNDDHLIYAKISYHFDRAKEKLKALEYQIKYLQTYYKFYHELFPVNDHPEEMAVEQIKFEKKETIAEFEKIRVRLDELKPTYENDPVYERLLMQFYSMEGRFYIRYGQYEEGLKASHLVIQIAKELNDSTFLLEGYKHLIYYCIQIEDEKEMNRYVELALSEAIRSNNHELIGILLRLKGLYYLMVGNLAMAEQQLNESIRTFKLTEAIEKKYAVNIAAAYDYLAEIRSIQEKFDEAIVLQQHSIDLCENKRAYSSLSVFYINMGIILFGKKDYEKSKIYFNKAYQIYERFSSLWKRPQLDAYMSLINMYEGNYDKVAVYLSSSKKYMEQFNSSRVLGTIYFAEAMIKHELVNFPEDKGKDLNEILNKDEAYYFEKAINHLSPNRNKLETNLLHRTFDDILTKSPEVSINQNHD